MTTNEYLATPETVLPAEPLANPPPCSQTITGRFPLSPRVQTLTTRQSSLMASW